MTLPQRSNALEIQESGDDVLVHDRSRSKIHVLNRSAAAVLRACDGATTVDALAAQFPQAPRERVRADIEATLTAFDELGLLEA